MKRKTFKELVKMMSEIKNCYDCQEVGLAMQNVKATQEEKQILWNIYCVYYKQFGNKE